MIVCLGWGSLIWDPDTLAVDLPWRDDGPEIRMEYARVSRDKRLTLVLGEGFKAVRSLWAPMMVTDASEAMDNLRVREGTARRYIGTWKLGNRSPKNNPGLANWAHAKRAAYVIWTALPPKYKGENGRIPTVEEALEHMTNLRGKSRQSAETYVRRTPFSIRTPYRQAFEETFGWQYEGT